MQFIKNNLTTIGILVAVVLAFYVYYAYFQGSSAPALTQADQSPASQDLLQSLANLKSIKLDPSIFSDAVFQSLTDFGVTIPPEAAGRPDPFAPIGASFATSTPGH